MKNKYSRRKFLEMSSILSATPFLPLSAAGTKGVSNYSKDRSNPLSKGSIDIGTRRQLFVDDFLLDFMSEGAKLQLHHPEAKELSVLFDKPWEGNACDFACVFQDGGIYRMYYGALQYNIEGKKITDDSHPYFLCYIESKDGIHWYRPELGIIEFQGSKANNIILDDRNVGAASPFPVAGAMFKDDNPHVSPDARYKSMIRNYSPKRSVPDGLLPMKSPDGIHWTLMSETPVITEGAFDSQNLAFWDAEHEEYRAYWRYKINSSIREIRTASSKDFLHWTNVEDLHYIDSPLEELYTNVVLPYYRAPQILIGLPVRYCDRGMSPMIKELPNPKNRGLRSVADLRFGTAITESLLMSSRDGVLFKRWEEAFLRPGIERPGTWNYGQQFIAWSMVETKSALEGAPNELSFYAMEGTWGTIPGYPKANGLRRHTLRLDGFVSVNAPLKGGEIITRPIIFKGDNLYLNYSTSAAGSIQVEIQDIEKRPIPGFTFSDCPEIFGDTVNRQISWKDAKDLSRLSGQEIRLHFLIKDADLYSFNFS